MFGGVLLRWGTRRTDQEEEDTPHRQPQRDPSQSMAKGRVGVGCLDSCDRRHLVQALADGELDGGLVLQLLVQVGHLDGEAFHAGDR